MPIYAACASFCDKTTFPFQSSWGCGGFFQEAPCGFFCFFPKDPTVPVAKVRFAAEELYRMKKKKAGEQEEA